MKTAEDLHLREEVEPVSSSSYSNAEFSRIAGLLEALAIECRSLPVHAGAMSDCVKLLGQITNVGISMDGVRTALVGRITVMQESGSDVHGSVTTWNANREQKSIAGYHVGDEGQATSEGSISIEQRDGHDRPCPKLPGRDRTLLKLIERIGRQSYYAAAKEIGVSQFVAGHFPQFVEQMRRGKVSAHYLEVLSSVRRTGALTRLAQEDEELLLEWALTQDLRNFRRSLKAWERKNGVKAARRVREAGEPRRREKLRFYPEDDGYTVSGWLTGESGSIVIRALQNKARDMAAGIMFPEEAATPSDREGTVSHCERQSVTEDSVAIDASSDVLNCMASTEMEDAGSVGWIPSNEPGSRFGLPVRGKREPAGSTKLKPDMWEREESNARGLVSIVRQFAKSSMRVKHSEARIDHRTEIDRTWHAYHPAKSKVSDYTGDFEDDGGLATGTDLGKVVHPLDSDCPTSRIVRSRNSADRASDDQSERRRTA